MSSLTGVTAASARTRPPAHPPARPPARSPAPPPARTTSAWHIRASRTRNSATRSTLLIPSSFSRCRRNFQQRQTIAGVVRGAFALVLFLCEERGAWRSEQPQAAGCRQNKVQMQAAWPPGRLAAWLLRSQCDDSGLVMMLREREQKTYKLLIFSAADIFFFCALPDLGNRWFPVRSNNPQLSTSGHNFNQTTSKF